MFPVGGTLSSMDPDINSPRVQSWNVSVEQQIGADWGVSASYLGSYSDRLWGLIALNPGVYLGLGPCTLQDGSFPVCTTNGNLNQRRVLSLSGENPASAALIANLDSHAAVGFQKYRGLKLSMQRRSTRGVNINANYTLSRCVGLEMVPNAQFGIGYVNPADPNYDFGHCETDRTHLANGTVGYETPTLDDSALGRLASNWRLAGIVSVRSGDRLTVVSGRDNAFNGQAPERQRVDQISNDVYGAKNAGELPESSRVRTTRAGHVRESRAQQPRGPAILENRPGCDAARADSVYAHAGGARRSLQPAQQLQLGPSRHSRSARGRSGNLRGLRCGRLRADPASGR